MKRNNLFQWYSVLLLACCLTACQVKRPDIVISDADMENVLYDYHIAKVMGEEVPYSESYKRVLYIETVFAKHGITQAQFDSSMVWYARNPEVLSKIYEKVNVRLKAERDGINHLIAIRDNKPKESLPGDSIDVWAWQRMYQLTGMPLDNKMTFTLPVDTNFKNRDTLRWSVRFRFHKDGKPEKEAMPVMAMQIVYKNDSVVSAFQKIQKAGRVTLSLFADTLGEMKEVRGFIYYPTPKASHTLLADRVLLMRYHATDTLAHASNDSISTHIKGEKTDTLKQKLQPTDGQDDSNMPRRENIRPRPKQKEQQESPQRIEANPPFRKLNNR